MNTTSLHIQMEPSIKKHAQKTASELGLSLTSVVKALLTQFIRTKRLNIGATAQPEIPNAYLQQSLKKAEEDIKTESTQVFDSWDEVFEHLSREIKDDKQGTD